jgi:two-component system, cell cycle response regulator
MPATVRGSNVPVPYEVAVGVEPARADRQQALPFCGCELGEAIGSVTEPTDAAYAVSSIDSSRTPEVETDRRGFPDSLGCFADLRLKRAPGPGESCSGGAPVAQIPAHSEGPAPPPPADGSEVRRSTVLVVEDSAAHRAELRRALECSPEIGEIVEATNGLAGLKTLLSRPLDAVLCDIELPSLDGEKLLAAKQQREELADIPILFVSANRDPGRKARLLERGASDILEKPFHPAELLARIGVHLRLRQLRNELREKNAQLEQLSIGDALTGLANRRFADSFLRREVERARRHSHPLSVLLADVDHFKQVNDVHGHGVGDAALRHVATVLTRKMRGTDACARWGGEEFLMGLVQVPAEGALTLAERQRAAVAAEPLVLPGGAIELTISIGVASLVASDPGPETLVAAADHALYRAKRAGRNRVELSMR